MPLQEKKYQKQGLVEHKHGCGSQEKSIKKIGVGVLPGKLTDCRDKTRLKLNYLLLRDTQLVKAQYKQVIETSFTTVPSRGKGKNTWKVSQDKLLKSEAISNRIKSIGIHPHSLLDDVDLTQLRYGRIIIISAEGRKKLLSN